MYDPDFIKWLTDRKGNFYLPKDGDESILAVYWRIALRLYYKLYKEKAINITGVGEQVMDIMYPKKTKKEYRKTDMDFFMSLLQKGKKP